MHIMMINLIEHIFIKTTMFLKEKTLERIYSKCYNYLIIINKVWA